MHPAAVRAVTHQHNILSPPCDSACRHTHVQSSTPQICSPTVQHQRGTEWSSCEPIRLIQQGHATDTAEDVTTCCRTPRRSPSKQHPAPPPSPSCRNKMPLLAAALSKLMSVQTTEGHHMLHRNLDNDDAAAPLVCARFLQNTWMLWQGHPQHCAPSPVPAIAATLAVHVALICRTKMTCIVSHP
jgi:hypothetical protein